MASKIVDFHRGPLPTPIHRRADRDARRQARRRPVVGPTMLEAPTHPADNAVTPRLDHPAWRFSRRMLARQNRYAKQSLVRIPQVRLRTTSSETYVNRPKQFSVASATGCPKTANFDPLQNDDRARAQPGAAWRVSGGRASRCLGRGRVRFAPFLFRGCSALRRVMPNTADNSKAVSPGEVASKPVRFAQKTGSCGVGLGRQI